MHVEVDYIAKSSSNSLGWPCSLIQGLHVSFGFPVSLQMLFITRFVLLPALWGYVLSRCQTGCKDVL